MQLSVFAVDLPRLNEIEGPMSDTLRSVDAIEHYDGSASAEASCKIDLWWIDLDDVRASAIPPWLPAIDRERIERMGTPLLRQRMAVTRIALRSILAQYANVSPDKLPLAANAHGWPYVDTRVIGKPLWFNLSHSQNRMLLAVSEQARLGVDLEKLDRNVNPDKLAPTVFNEADCRWLNAQADRQKAFLKLWTAKEAVLKLCGTGFQIPAPFVTIDWPGMQGAIQGEAKYHPHLRCQLRAIEDEDLWSAHLALAVTANTMIKIRTCGGAG